MPLNFQEFWKLIQQKKFQNADFSFKKSFQAFSAQQQEEI